MRRPSTMETNTKKLIKIQARKNKNSVHLSEAEITKYFMLRMPRYMYYCYKNCNLYVDTIVTSQNGSDLKYSDTNHTFDLQFLFYTF